MPISGHGGVGGTHDPLPKGAFARIHRSQDRIEKDFIIARAANGGSSMDFLLATVYLTLRPSVEERSLHGVPAVFAFKKACVRVGHVPGIERAVRVPGFSMLCFPGLFRTRALVLVGATGFGFGADWCCKKWPWMPNTS